MSSKYASVDVGTTSVKLAVYDSDLNLINFESVGLPLSPGGTHDPAQLLSVVRHLALRAKDSGARSLGIATYRASMVAWDRDGRPLSSVLTWLSSESFEEYRKLSAAVRLLGRVPPLNLIVSPNSPALRYLALWNDVKRKGIQASDAMIWTLESFLVHSLTGRYVADAANATLTGFIDPSSFKEISLVPTLLGVKPNLPEVVDNTERVGEYEGMEISALSGDQQAACVGDACVSEGMVKVTNGTGTFVDVISGSYKRVNGLIPVVVLRYDKRSVYGLEGYLPTSGLAVDLLKRIGVISDYSDLEGPLEGNALFVPALAGLQFPSAPHARGVISNIDLGLSKGAVVSALLKSVAFHVRMVLERSGIRPKALRANGKLSKSDNLLRLISSVVGLPVERQTDIEATLRGLLLLQLLGEGRVKLSELEKTRSGVNLISGEGVVVSQEEYLKWVSMVRSLKS